MFPQTFSESAKEAAERQANYLILRSLEEKLPPDLFQQILNQLSGTLSLPKRIRWDGVPADADFSEMKVSHAEVNSQFLPRLLQGINERGNNSSPTLPETIKNSNENKNLSYFLKQFLVGQSTHCKNIYAQLNSKKGRFGSLAATLAGGSTPYQDRNKVFQYLDLANIERMKTVFCHADFNTNEVSSIFNVCYDKSGHFIVSGADDGIIKIWDRDTLTLQASLHGHQDFITDIEVSKCNRFIASSGNDANLILWELASGKLVHRFTNHTSLINRLTFFSPKPQANARVTQQYLLSCSDDGTVQLQDLTPLAIPRQIVDEDHPGQLAQGKIGKGQSHPGVTEAELEEFRVRRSSRRVNVKYPNESEKADEDPDQAMERKCGQLFTLQLTQSDFRPGQRNKKIDTLCINSAGLVLAGTNTGELFAWKVYFGRIQDRASHSQSDLQRFIGHYKLFKNNVGIQFTEFGPVNDNLLLLGATDGQVKVWNTEMTQKDRPEMKFLELENDLNRLKITIDEQQGCVQYNQLKVRVEKGLDNSGEDIDADSFQIFTDRIVKRPIEGPRKILQNIKKSQCDMVKWSCRGRFVIASITTLLEAKKTKEEEKKGEANARQQEEEKAKEEVCRIKIFDFVTETYIDDLARSSGFALKKNTWVLAPHPTCEEILMTGSDGGQLLLWNLQSKRILKRFTQYGVYSIDTYVMDNPLDGKFSPDGRSFLVGSQLGTISLFAHKSLAHQYEATRVQQFFPFDVKEANENRVVENRFEKLEKQPQICGFNMIPYEVQPTVPRIGKYALQYIHQTHAKNQLSLEQQYPTTMIDGGNNASARQSIKATYEEFERGLAVAKELGFQEERYYKDQTQAGDRDNFFNAAPNLEVLNDGIGDFPESSIAPQEDRNHMDGAPDSEVNEAISMINSGRPQQGSSPTTNRRLIRSDQYQVPQEQNPVLRSQSPHRTLRQRNPQPQQQSPPSPPPDNYLTRQLIMDESPRLIQTEMRQEGRLRQRNVPTMLENQGSDDEEMKSEEEGVNPDELESSMDDHDEYGDSEDSPDSYVLRHSRLRAEGINTRRNMWDRAQNDYAERLEQRKLEDRAQRALRRRNLVDSPELAGGSDDEEILQRSSTSRVNAHRAGGTTQLGLAGFNAGAPDSSRTRRLRRNRGVEDQDSFVEPISMQEDMSESIALRKKKKESSKSKRRAIVSSQETEQKKDQSRRPARGLARSGVIGNEEDDSPRESDSFAVDANEDQSDSVRATPSKDRMGVYLGSQPDMDYTFITNDRKIKEYLARFPNCNESCAMCTRADEPLVGPFVKHGENQRTAIIGEPLYFHRNCIEVNQFSFFRLSDNVWVNIQEALNNLVTHAQYKCERCGTNGASVQCISCKRCYHGHLCSQLMTIDISTSNAAQVLPKRRKMQCLFCRNTQNYGVFQADRVPTFDQEQHKDSYLLNAWKKLDRDHLLQNSSSLVDEKFSFVPQLNDILYYFYQGHEEYMTQYSCFFFAGEEKELKAKDVAPWIAYPQLKDEILILCRVVEIDYDFPKRRAVKLLKKYGSESTSVLQKPELVQLVKLEVITKVKGFSTQKPLQFTVSLFPHALSSFIILKEVFETKMTMFEQQCQTQQEFKLLTKKVHEGVISVGPERVKIINAATPFEPSTQPKSYWKHVKVQVLPLHRFRRSPSEMPLHRSSRRRNDQIEEDNGQSAEDQELNRKRVNFWDLDFEMPEAQITSLRESHSAFIEDERVKLVNFLEEFLDKKKELCLFFRNRVTEEIAADYRSIVPTDMYLTLILERLSNHYYRDQMQLFADLDLISHNSQSYNGDKNEITEEAEAMVESIRAKMRPLINDKAETALAKKMQLAQIIRSEFLPKAGRTGKETAPSTFKNMSSMEQIMAQYDKFKSNKNASIEEVKEEEPAPTAPPPKVQKQQCEDRAARRLRRTVNAPSNFGISGVASSMARQSVSVDLTGSENEEEEEDMNNHVQNQQQPREDNAFLPPPRQTRSRYGGASDLISQSEMSINSSLRPRRPKAMPECNGMDNNLGRKRNRQTAQLDQSGETMVKEVRNDKSVADDQSAVSGRLRQRGTDDQIGANKRQHL